MSGEPRHFLDLDRLDGATLRHILDRGRAFKEARVAAADARPLDGKSVALIFEKPSTRTRISFELAVHQLGGHALAFSDKDSQLGRGETIADTARVLSRYVDAIMIRTGSPDKLHDLAHHATVPVINGLTDKSHPCQLMADIMTFEENRGPIAGRTVAWSGDGNNMAATWVHAAARFDFRLRLACPDSLMPPGAVLDWAREAGAQVMICATPDEAVRDADCVVTDAWLSMGDDAAESRHKLLAPYRVDERLMALARDDAIFMHCLPAHRGDEVVAAIIDGPQSVVWDEAENRLHAQKGILAWCLGR